MLANNVWEVRAQAAMSSGLSIGQVERLLLDNDERVRAIAADLNRDIPTELILRVLARLPGDADKFAFHATAPGMALGHKCLNWVSNDNLSTYLEFKGANASQATKLAEALALHKSEMITLNELWEIEFETEPGEH